MVRAARHPAVTSALEHHERIPRAGAAAVSFNAAVQELAYPLVRRAQEDHMSIVEAPIRREEARAEALRREQA
jgi:hypothetical protein